MEKKQIEKDTVESLRAKIDSVNEEFTALYEERMRLGERMAACKLALGLPVYDEQRERETIERMCALVPEKDRAGVVRMFELLIGENRFRQERILEAERSRSR